MKADRLLSVLMLSAGQGARHGARTGGAAGGLAANHPSRSRSAQRGARAGCCVARDRRAVGNLKRAGGRRFRRWTKPKCGRCSWRSRGSVGHPRLAAAAERALNKLMAALPRRSAPRPRPCGSGCMWTQPDGTRQAKTFRCLSVVQEAVSRERKNRLRLHQGRWRKNAAHRGSAGPCRQGTQLVPGGARAQTGCGRSAFRGWNPQPCLPADSSGRRALTWQNSGRNRLQSSPSSKTLCSDVVAYGRCRAKVASGGPQRLY